MRKTVLVLGAGASVAVGYPVGAELRRMLLDLPSPAIRQDVKSAGLLGVENELYEFVETFRLSQMSSIDAFLARRPEFTDIGKRAIAFLLLRCESPTHLFEPDHSDHWYQYLFNSVASESWGSLDLANLTIITFNYDRSLEHYLYTAFRSAYGKSAAEVLEKLASLNILHVYGTLGATLPAYDGYFSYGSGASSVSTDFAAQMIKVIPEGRADDVVIRKAREQLVAADHIAFLGFGFDGANLNRLDSEMTCRSHIMRADGSINRRKVVATCLGMTDAEIARAVDLTAGRDGSALIVRTGSHSIGNGIFLKSDCLTVLRSTLIL